MRSQFALLIESRLTMHRVIEVIAAVSFAETPLEEIGPRANQILRLGWTVRDRGDPWVILVAKHFDESERLPEAELHNVMGDYWVSPGRFHEFG